MLYTGIISLIIGVSSIVYTIHYDKYYFVCGFINLFFTNFGIMMIVFNFTENGEDVRIMWSRVKKFIKSKFKINKEG